MIILALVGAITFVTPFPPPHLAGFPFAAGRPVNSSVVLLPGHLTGRWKCGKPMAMQAPQRSRALVSNSSNWRGAVSTVGFCNLIDRGASGMESLGCARNASNGGSNPPPGSCGQVIKAGREVISYVGSRRHY